MGAGDVVEGGGEQGDVGGCNIINIEWRGGAMAEEGLLVGGGEVDEGDHEDRTLEVVALQKLQKL